MNLIYIKLLVGLILFAAWFYLSTQNVPNSTAIVAFIQLTLGALAHNLISQDTTSSNLTVQQNTPVPQVVQQAPVATEPPKPVVIPLAPATPTNP